MKESANQYYLFAGASEEVGNTTNDKTEEFIKNEIWKHFFSASDTSNKAKTTIETTKNVPIGTKIILKSWGR